MIKHINIDIRRRHFRFMYAIDHWRDNVTMKDLRKYVEAHPEVAKNVTAEKDETIVVIHLIKAYRVLTNAGLLEAKTAVEFMLEKEKGWWK